MLKKPLLALLSLLCVLNLVAQKPEFTPSTYLGITAGGAFNRVGFTPYVKQNMLADNSFGVMFRHVSEPNIGVQIELNYAGRGWTENLDSLGNYTRNLTVLDIPFTAAFIIGSKKLRFAINLGPDVTYLLHDQEKISITDTSNYKGYYGQPMSQSWSFGFTGGASVEYYTRFGAFAIRASYNYMLTNYFSLRSDIFYYEESRAQTLNLGVSYFIKLF
jgi:hypothetical protein